MAAEQGGKWRKEEPLRKFAFRSPRSNSHTEKPIQTISGSNGSKASAVRASRPGCDRFVQANRPIRRTQTCTATCHSGPSSYLGPRPCFYGVRAGPPGATVGVLATGVPRSTCWKAQLRPIYINAARSSSTSPSTRRAQGPRGGVPREEAQDQPDEGFPITPHGASSSPPGPRTTFTTKEPPPRKGETWLPPIQADLHHQKGAACKE